MNDSQVMVKIGIKNEEGQVETLWATPVAQNLYRLENSPFRAYGISWLDIVRAEPDEDGFRFFVKVEKKSGHRTVRVIVEADSSMDVPTLISQLEILGCTCEGAFSQLIAIDIPAQVELRQVTEYLVSVKLQWEYVDPTYDEVQAEHKKKS